MFMLSEPHVKDERTRWSSAAARGLQHPTTVMITNKNDDVREANKSTGPAKAAVVVGEIFLGIDAADARQVVTRFVPGEGPKPAEGMTKDTLVRRVAQLLKAGFRCAAFTRRARRASRWPVS